MVKGAFWHLHPIDKSIQSFHLIKTYGDKDTKKKDETIVFMFIRPENME